MNPFNSLIVRGKIGNRVYQKVKPGLGNVPGDPTKSLQNRAYVATNTSATPAQLECRAKFGQACAAWNALSAEDKKTWKTAASKKAITGFNHFVSQWIKTH